MNSPPVETLKNLDWKNLTPILLEHAHNLVCRYRWRGLPISYKKGAIPMLDSRSPADFVQITVQKILTGVRAFPRDGEPVAVLKKCIESEIDNFAKKHCTHNFVAELQPSQSETEDSNPLDLLADPSPPQNLAEEEAHKEQFELLQTFETFISEDYELRLVMMCYQDDMVKTALIAAETGLPPGRVSELKRKLRRQAHKFFAQTNRGPGARVP